VRFGTIVLDFQAAARALQKHIFIPVRCTDPAMMLFKHRICTGIIEFWGKQRPYVASAAQAFDEAVYSGNRLL